MDIDITDIVRDYLIRYTAWVDDPMRTSAGHAALMNLTNEELVDEFLKEIL